MLTVGIDVHSKLYAVCVMNESGVVTREKTIRGGVADVTAWVRTLAAPTRVCYEASLGYGLLHDSLKTVKDTEVHVAHPAHLRAIFAAKKKNDRIDARKLARVMLLDQVPEVYVPEREVREWRQLIEHRNHQVGRRTRAMNSLRALLRGLGIGAPKGLWSRKGMAWVRGVDLSSPMAALRRDQLALEIDHFSASIRAVEKTLDAFARSRPGVELLTTIPGVGPRTAEAIMAYVDDPGRFGSTRRAAAYFGLVPSLDESAGVRRLGRITKRGPGTARKLLVEATWQGIRRSPTLRAFYERIRGGKKERTRKAVVATAHHLVKVMVAMLKSGEEWRERVGMGGEATPSRVPAGGL